MWEEIVKIDDYEVAVAEEFAPEEMVEENSKFLPKMSEDRRPKPPEDYFRRRPQNPNFTKSWFDILKAVDIDFASLPDVGWAGVYDRVEDKITINLAAWKDNESAMGTPGKVSDKEIEDQIIETISHESGHAAALSKDAADLNDEIIIWVADQVMGSMDLKDETGFTAKSRGVLGQVVNYLVHEYIADLVAGKKSEDALKNAWDQVVIARGEEWIGMLGDAFHAEGDFDSMINLTMKLFDGISPWEVVEELLPILDKYFNKISEKIFRSYKTGMSRQARTNWGEWTDDDNDVSPWSERSAFSERW